MSARLLSLAFSGLLVAQTPPAPAPRIPAYEQLKYPPLRQIEIPQVVTHTLPNGMRLYLLENHELPLIGGTALVRTGNLFDPSDKVGLASLTGDVIRTGGTRDKTGDQLDEQLENLAASVESDIGETSGSVSFSCLRENIDEVLAVFKDVLTAPEFRDDKLDLAKTQYRSLIARRNDDPGGIASREFSEILYGRDNPYGWRVEYEHVGRVNRDDLHAFHKRYFFPANVMLTVHGDFSAPEMRARLEKLFAQWTSTQPAVPPFPEVTAKPAHGVFLAAKDDVNQTFFRIGHLGGMLRDKDYPALEVMADILGGGFASRLFTKVRTELGYAYNVGAAWGANYGHPGIFRVSGSTKSGSTTDTFEVVLKEVERLRTTEVTTQELETAKQTVLNSFVFNFDQPSKTLNRLVAYDYYGYPKNFIFEYQKAVAAVTKADILRVAKQHLRPQEFTVVAVGKPSEFGRPLTELNLPVKPIDLTIPEPKKETARADSASLSKGKELLQRVQQAMGGVDKLAAVKDMTASAEVNVTAPQGAMKVGQFVQWLSPSTIRQEQVLPFGKMTAFFDGATGWLALPQGVQSMPPPVIRQVRSSVLRILPALAMSDRVPGRQVNLVGERLIEITEAEESVKIKVDPNSGLPLQLIYQSIQMTGAPAAVEDTFAEWRDVNGIKLPFKVAVKQNGSPYADVTVQEIKLNTGVTAETLSKKP